MRLIAIKIFNRPAALKITDKITHVKLQAENMSVTNGTISRILTKITTKYVIKFTNSSFQHAAPHFWNKLPHSFHEPHPHPGLSPSHYPTQVGSTLPSPPLSPSITPSLFHSRLKTHIFLRLRCSQLSAVD